MTSRLTKLLTNRTMNQYELEERLEHIQKLGRADKKTKGIGRDISRLVDQMVSYVPSIPNCRTIDFTISLFHYSPGGGAKPDWYARILHDHGVLQNKREFEQTACMVQYERWVSAVAEACIYSDQPNDEPQAVAEFVSAVLFRWEQVEVPNEPNSNRVMPVITLVIPFEFDQWSVTMKLKLLDVIVELATSGELNTLSSRFNNARTHRLYGEELVHYTDRLYDDVVNKRSTLLDSWVCDERQFFEQDSLFENHRLLTPSSYTLNPDVVYQTF